MEEVHSQHFGDGENPHRVRDVFEHFVVEESGKSCGSLCITRRADTSLPTGEHEQPLATTRTATKPGEATFRRGTIEVTSHHGVGEASPASVGLLEAVLPEALDVLVVRLDQLK